MDLNELEERANDILANIRSGMTAEGKYNTDCVLRFSIEAIVEILKVMNYVPLDCMMKRGRKSKETEF